MLLALTLIRSVYGVEANLAPSPYVRDEWSGIQTLPSGTVYTIAQTPDGYLWIGGEKGLVRFDGFRFRPFSGFSSGAIQQLMTDPEGDLWIRQQSMRLLRYRNGSFEDTLRGVDRGEGATAMCADLSRGVMFALFARRIVDHSGGVFRAFLPEAQTPQILIISMAATPDGKLWMGTRDQGLYVWHNGKTEHYLQELPDPKVNVMLPFDNGEIWVGTDNGVVRLAGNQFSREGVPLALQRGQILSLIKDRRTNIWAGTGNGLLRVDLAAPSLAAQMEDESGNVVNTVFEDREGNIWAGTDQGLERFREEAFLSYASAGSLARKADGPVYVDEKDRIWSNSPEGGLTWRERGATGNIVNSGLADDKVYSITGRNQELWVGRQQGGMTHIICRNDCVTKETYTHRQGLAQDHIYSVFESARGVVWAGTISNGVSKLQNGKLTSYNAENGLGSNRVTDMEEGPDGTMWFATADGLSTLSSQGWRTYRGSDGVPPGGVNCLSVDPSGILWIGTRKGLGFVRSGRIELVRTVGSLSQEVLGIAGDRGDSLWIATVDHILRVPRRKLLDGTVMEQDVRDYETADGLLSSSVLKRSRSVITDLLGRVWFSTSRGISVVDSSRLRAEAVPAIVHIEGVSADGSTLPLKSDVSVASARKRITFRYVALSLSVPERIRFRYKLESFDRDWSEPTASREAVYTNLNPGFYRFRLLASNAYGMWNASEAGIGLQVEPAFWQSWWFRLLLAASVLLMTAIVHRLRLGQITRQLDLRFQERLSERTRIAQEFHDTLLQSFLSASLQTHVALNRLPDTSPAKAPLKRAIEMMDRGSREGRSALRGLRSSEVDPFSLELAFSRIPQELSLGPKAEFVLRVEGRQCRLRPALFDDVYRIGREAIANAFSHSSASRIEVEVEYAPNQLRVLVQDNGCGMDARMLHLGREEHWGLTGMRERADRIGAKLTLLSSLGAGTQVLLCVPSQLAFQPEARDKCGTWFSRLFRNKFTRDASRKKDRDEHVTHN